MTHHYVAGEGALWAQVNGPNTAPVYLGCHQIGDIDEPQGDVELIYCPDPSGPSRFKVVNSLQGAAGAVTTSITTDVTDELDYLEQAKCSLPIYVHMVKAGLKNVFTNYDRSFVLTNARITSRGLTGLTARTPDDNSRSEQSFELSAESLIRAVRLELNRQVIEENTAINDVTFCNAETCGTEEEVGMSACQVGFLVRDQVSASPAVSANVYKTTNGSTWTAEGTTDPFVAGKDIIAIECFEMGRDSIRVLVGNGTTTSGTAMQVAYSDNSGANWTLVSVGESAQAHCVPTSQSLFALNRSNIWVGSSGGYIYYSNDGGASWNAQDTGTIHTGAWNAIHFSDEMNGWAGGGTNKIARTIDGGESWSAITGPSANTIMTIFGLDRNRAWVGYSNGTLYFTRDGGITWTQRTFSGSGVGWVKDIKFYNDYVGVMIRVTGTFPNPTGGNVLMTIDGGYTWEPMTTPTNSGLNSVYICNEHSFFVVGEANGNTGYIAKASV